MTTLFVTDSALAKSHIPGYTKKDGTFVKPHEDSRSKKAEPPKAAKWSATGAAPTMAGKHSYPSAHPGQYSQPGQYASGGFGSLFAPQKTPKAYHPKVDDKGKAVGLFSPSKRDLAGLQDPDAIVTITPGSTLPDSLNGIPFAEWSPPTDDARWDYVEGVNDELDEPVFAHEGKLKPASGLIIREPDGRVWVVSPTNKFGNYENTFPKGKVDGDDMSYQANAIKEAWEEAGIKARVVGFLGDVVRTTSKTRYYLAERVAGHPGRDVGWESQAVHLVPVDKLKGFLDAKVDHQVVDLLAALPAKA